MNLSRERLMEFMPPRYHFEDGDGESTEPARNRDPETVQAAREIAVLKRQIQEHAARMARVNLPEGRPDLHAKYRVENVPSGSELRFMPPTDPYADD